MGYNVIGVYRWLFPTAPAAAMITPLSQCHALLGATMRLAKLTHGVHRVGRRETGRQGRSEGGYRVGGREQGEGGSDDAIGRDRASVEEGLLKGISEERTERGMDGARERGEGGSERRRD